MRMMDDSKQFVMMDTGETTLQFADERATVAFGMSCKHTGRRSRSPPVSWRSWPKTCPPPTTGRGRESRRRGRAGAVTLRQTHGYLLDLTGCRGELASPAPW